MDRQVEVYADWPDHDPGTLRWRCGSGYLLDGRLILTAAHVVCPAGRPLRRVLVRVAGGMVAAEVAWYRLADYVDVALLVVSEPEWAPPPRRQSVRFGRMVTTRSSQPCRAVGFPAVVAEPRRRDTHDAAGMFNPWSLVKSRLYAMEVANPPSAGVGWAGMSGAAMLCKDFVVGVVTTDPSGFDGRRLIAVPVFSFAVDGDFRRLIEEHAGRAFVVEAVEFDELQGRSPEPKSPAGLLRADAALTPFRPRPELDRLEEWCRCEEWSSTRLVVGPAGQGKTRLARRLAERLVADGWASVLLAERATDTEIAVLRDVAVPTLVVVDYVEGRTDQLGAVFDALASTHEKTRLLLVARTAGAWRSERVDPSPHLELLVDDRIVVELGPLEATLEGRAEAWRQATTALARPLGELAGYRGVDWGAVANQLPVPRLVGSRYRTILAVQMHALAALLQASAPIPDVGDQPEDVLLAHERRYWRRAARQFDVILTAANQRYLVTAATLWGAAEEHEAHQVLTVTELATDRNALANTADWLATLYGDGEHYWSGMQPDALAEYLVGTDVRCADLVAGTIDTVSPGQLEHGLTLLGRAHPRHQHLTRTITDAVLRRGRDGAIAAIAVAPRLEQPQPLLTALDVYTPTADLPTLWELSDTLPLNSLSLAEISMRIAEALVARLREAAPVEPHARLPDLAASMHNLGVRLGGLGRWAEAVAAGRAAVELRRALLVVDRGFFMPGLAKSVDQLAVALGKVGRRSESLAVGQETVELYQGLVADNHDAHLPDLARSMHNLAVLLSDAERREEALTVARTAVELRQDLVAVDRDRYLPKLASSVALHASALAVVGRRVEGLTVAREAVKLWRALVESNRDAHLPDLAVAIGNLGGLFAELGRRVESLAAARESVELWREMVAGNRDAYQPRLARAMHNLADSLGAMGRLAEALAAAQETVELGRELVVRNRDAHLPDLAHSISNLAVRLGQANRQAEAPTAAQEAVDLSRELVGRDRDAYLPALAEAVNNLSLGLGEVGRVGEALAAAEEAVNLSRELVARNREAYLFGLSKAIYNLSNGLSGAGRRNEALAAAREHHELCRELVADNRETHLPALAGAVFLLSVRLFEMNRHAESAAASREAVGLCRELVKINHDAHLPLLAAALINLTAQQFGAGQPTEAHRLAHEAVGYFYELAQRDPDIFGARAAQADFLMNLLESGQGIMSMPGATPASQFPVDSPGSSDRRSTGVSPILNEFARQLGDVMSDDPRGRIEVPRPSLAGTANDGLDERRGYLALDWLIRDWLATWLDLLPGGRAGATSLRQLAPLIDAGVANQAGRIVRQAVLVPELPIVPDYVHPAFEVTVDSVISQVVESVSQEAMKATGWDAAYSAVPVAAGGEKVLRIAADTARKIAVYVIEEAVDEAVRYTAERSRRRHSRWTELRHRIRGYSVDPAATDPSLYETGARIAWTLLAPTVVRLQGGAVDLLSRMIEGRS